MSAAARQAHRLALLLAALLAAAAVAGCSNPDAPAASSPSTVSPANEGEPVAPPPASPASQASIGVQATPQQALVAFASRYVNWSSGTLAADQRHLAAMAVGPARLAERQAAASSQADATLRRSRVWNHGQVISIAPDRARSGWWVIVTRERTGGSGEYEGLPAALHVTLARLARLAHGYAVERWSPQN